MILSDLTKTNSFCIKIWISNLLFPVDSSVKAHLFTRRIETIYIILQNVLCTTFHNLLFADMRTNFAYYYRFLMSSCFQFVLNVKIFGTYSIILGPNHTMCSRYVTVSSESPLEFDFRV